ncbi:MAG TPA: penicillin-binding protein 1A, partial [Longimicrobiaceae bacterium]|nr:penicillin-binding protein 1A [Longimicrobiaceae bacterium]
EYQVEGSVLLDTNGDPFARLATVNRRIVSIDSLPPHLPQAFVAIEDQRFYDHGGVDFFRTAGALVRNVRSGEVTEGGSTITQQLARNLFPEWLPYTQRNMRRKVLEARVARQIERTFSKGKILELYINHIYLGAGAYGVEAAAQRYFGKPATELTVAEAALIAGLPQAPSQINPIENFERSTQRRNLVLDQMVDAGYLSAADAADEKDAPVVLAEVEGDSEGPRSSYFVERVRGEMEERVGSRFYTAGLQIHTTLDPVAQQAAEDELVRQLSAIESGRFGAYRHPTYSGTREEEGGSTYLQGAVVVLDIRSGEVRALVGGRNFDDSKFNRATQALRQPGSAFKPFVYAAALERYRSPAHQVEDSPVQLTLSGGQVWAPQNYSGTYDGQITMREAITRSKNAATVRLAQEVGIRSVIGVARDAGITSDIPDVPATALGAADVRPIELVAAYAAFGNGGHRIEPHLITRVVDRTGNVLWQAEPRTNRALDPAVAFVLTTMLQDVVDRGTGSAVRAVGFRAPAAGKTGTTNDASDVWFVGYTPEIAAGIWIGLDEPATIVRGASGGTLAAPVWGRMMNRIYANRSAPEGWRPPSGVTTAEVDRVTGAAVSQACPAQGPVYTEYFIRSSPPRQYCPEYDYEPRITYGDSLWIDEEWNQIDAELPAAELPGEALGVDWPELEALRRRIRQAQEDLERRRGIDLGRPGAPPADGPVPRQDQQQPSPGAGPLPGDPAPGTPAPPPQTGLPTPEPPLDPPDPPADDAPDPADDGPELLGTPVQR